MDHFSGERGSRVSQGLHNLPKEPGIDQSMIPLFSPSMKIRWIRDICDRLAEMAVGFDCKAQAADMPDLTLALETGLVAEMLNVTMGQFVGNEFPKIPLKLV